MKKSLVVLSALALALTTACGAQPSQSGADQGGGDASGSKSGTLTFSWGQLPDTFDPDKLTLRQMVTYLRPVYDGLTNLTNEQVLEPMLATEWSQGSDEKGPYLDMTLRSGLNFDDGTPFTSKTVVLNIERSQKLQGSTNVFGLRGVTVEAVDPEHVRFRSALGVGYLPRLLSGPEGIMISDKAITDKLDLSTQTYGIGPFKVDSKQPNQVTYSKAKDYWDKDAAKVDKLVILQQSDDARLNALRSGSIDITVVPAKVAQTATAAGYKIEKSFDTGSSAFYLNTNLPPLNNPKVREALHLALDREGICKAVLAGSCKAHNQLFGVGAKEHDPNADGNVGNDIEKAKGLIQEAGAAGAEISVSVPAGNQIAEQTGAVFQQNIEALGMKAKIVPLTTAQLFARFAVEQNMHITFGGMGLFFDPSQTVARVLPDGGFNPGKNIVGEQIPGLLKQAQAESDPDRQTEIYRKISTSLSQEGYVIPIYTQEINWVVGKNVGGWNPAWAIVFPSFRGVSN